MFVASGRAGEECRGAEAGEEGNLNVYIWRERSRSDQQAHQGIESPMVTQRASLMSS